MKGFATFFKQKQVLIGFVAVIVAVTLLSFANLGSTVNPTPQEVPVALVMADQGMKLPTGQEMNFGKLISEKLTAATTPTGDASPFTWTVVESEEAVREALDAGEYYGALVIPADLTQRILSMQGKTPQGAEVEVLINQGKNFTGATMVGQALDKMIIGVNQQLREQMLAEIQKRGDQLNTAQARALATPIKATVTNVNEVGTHSANGNGPVMLTTVMWMAGMAGTITLFLAVGKVQQGRLGAIIGQLLTGALIAALASVMVLLITHGVLGLHIENLFQTGLVLAFVCYCFFLMQTMVVNWLGFAGMPIFILIFFFGAPVLGMPVEFLPDFTKDWFYSWVPLRFAVASLRDVMYFGGVNLADHAWTLAYIGMGSSVLALASFVKKGKGVQGKGQAQEQTLATE